VADESVAHLLTGICDPCGADNHDGCVAEALGDGCTCQCTGTVECPTCGSVVVLYADPSEPGLSNGHCCHWMWADWWEGTFRYDLDAVPES
jgi:hypothetical protein